MYSSHIKIFAAAIIVAFLIAFGVSFIEKAHQNDPPERVKTLGKTNAVTLNNIEITRLTDEVDHGLNLVKVNDTLNLLIYRGVESVSMIQIK